MPYANIALTCQTCGKEFKHRHQCMKSRDVDSYIDWAKENVTECPECHAQSKRNTEAAKMHNDSVVIRVSYKDYKIDFSMVRSVPNSYDAATKTVEISIEPRWFEEIALYAKSDDELVDICVREKGASREKAVAVVPQYRAKVESSMKNIIGEGWKKLISDYIDQFPASEEEPEEIEVEEAPEEFAENEETPIAAIPAPAEEKSAEDPVETETAPEAPAEETAETEPEEPAEMTIVERIKKAVKNLDCETDNIDKLVALAYYIGREDATREISDKYNAVLAEQRKRADSSRFHNLANEIIGNTRYIHSSDYSQDMKTMFGSDKTKL